jgi:tetratricopeptide (TPR) repeat protein
MLLPNKAIVDALLTKARALSAQGETADSLAAYERAGELARQVGAAGLTRKALREWADALASAGLHQQAFELAREALAVS